MRPPLCAVAVIPDRSYVRVVAAGDLDLATAPQLRAEIDGLLEVGWLDVTVDLREATFADTAAVHVLLDADRRVRELDGALTVLVEQGPVARLLSITGTDRLLCVVC